MHAVIPPLAGLPLLVGMRFQVLFHFPYGILFTFPSRYWFTIGRQEYLALPRGRGRFTQGFSCPALLGVGTESPTLFAYGAVTLYGGPFQVSSAKNRIGNFPSKMEICRPTTPAFAQGFGGFRLFPFRSPLLRESNSLSFPRATEMVQFARFPSRKLSG